MLERVRKHADSASTAGCAAFFASVDVSQPSGQQAAKALSDSIGAGRVHTYTEEDLVRTYPALNGCRPAVDLASKGEWRRWGNRRTAEPASLAWGFHAEAINLLAQRADLLPRGSFDFCWVVEDDVGCTDDLCAGARHPSARRTATGAVDQCTLRSASSRSVRRLRGVRGRSDHARRLRGPHPQPSRPSTAHHAPLVLVHHRLASIPRPRPAACAAEDRRARSALLSSLPRRAGRAVAGRRTGRGGAGVVRDGRAVALRIPRHADRAPAAVPRRLALLLRRSRLATGVGGPRATGRPSGRKEGRQHTREAVPRVEVVTGRPANSELSARGRRRRRARAPSPRRVRAAPTL